MCFPKMISYCSPSKSLPIPNQNMSPCLINNQRMQNAPTVDMWNEKVYDDDLMMLVIRLCLFRHKLVE